MAPSWRPSRLSYPVPIPDGCAVRPRTSPPATGRRRLGRARPAYSGGELQAYLATRVPATFAATRRVLSELAALRPGWVPTSILDLGAGPGTATWAAFDVFGPIGGSGVCRARPGHGRPRRPDGQSGGQGGSMTADYLDGRGRHRDRLARERPRHRGLRARRARRRSELSALRRWWGVTRGELVLVEPGTPAGFERLRAARTMLIEMGRDVTAPCPHDEICPMTGSDWCHFAVRLERSSLHRDLKGAKLGYEDEKYAYLVVSSCPPPAPQARSGALAAPAQRTRAARRVRAGRLARACRQPPRRRALQTGPGRAMG